MTMLFHDPRFIEHVTSPHHPECPARLVQIWSRISDRGLHTRCKTGQVQPIDRKFLASVHSAEQIALAETVVNVEAMKAS